jgi:hypothetical protein
MVVRKIILNSLTGVINIRRQIWAVWFMFQKCPLEALQELCLNHVVDVGRGVPKLSCSSKTPVVSRPGRCRRLVTSNRSRVSLYDAAFNLVPFP